METLLIDLVVHQGVTCLSLKFPYNDTLKAIVKQLAGARWSAAKKAWLVDDTAENRSQIKVLFKGKAILTAGTGWKRMKAGHAVQLQVLPDEVKASIEKYCRYLRSGRYSNNTVKTYSEALSSFLKFFGGKPASEITNEDVVTYNNDFILKYDLSASYQNQVVNAIKLFFRLIENKRIAIDEIKRPRKQKLLPNVLSKGEIKKILEVPVNIKHRTMLSLIYSCGLRRSELLNLKPNDIDSKRNIILIRQGKGRKDRIAPLSEKIIVMLREYYKMYRPITWLFEGQKKNEQYNERSLSSVLKQALAKAKINKPVSLHWLRHSYATHLLEAGTDLHYIQEILGHKSSKTTEIYTHVSTKSIQNIKSPFDDL